jgi:hypothetical protein
MPFFSVKALDNIRKVRLIKISCDEKWTHVPTMKNESRLFW